VAGVGDHKVVRLWDAVTGRMLRSLPVSSAHASKTGESVISSLAFSPDGKLLAAGSSQIHIWNVHTGRLQRTLPITAGKAIAGKDFEKWIASVAFSPDGKVLAAGSKSGTIRIWDTNTWQWKGNIKEQFSLETLAFAPDGVHLACGDGAGINIWNIRTRKQLRSLYRMSYDVRSLAFSPDSKVLVSGGDRTPWKDDWSIFDYGGYTGEVHIWDVKTGRLNKVLPLAEQRVYSVAFTSSGKSLAVGYSDGIRIWDTQNWSMRQSRGLQGSTAQSVSFSPDSRTLAVSTNKGDVRLLATIEGKRGFLGVITETIVLPKTLSRVLNPKGNKSERELGLRIVNVGAGTPAATNRLQKGDILLSINGKDLYDHEELYAYLYPLYQGEIVTLRIWRQNQFLTMRVKLGITE
jgi:WD40 repeat protein